MEPCAISTGPSPFLGELWTMSDSNMQYYTGVDLGGTMIKLAVGDGDGNILAEHSTPTDSHGGPEGVLGRIAQGAREVASKAGVEPAAMGIGLPGTVDIPNGKSVYLSNMPTHWRDVPVADILSEKLNYPVYILNDARVATLAELDFGVGRDSQSLTMIFLGLGTGIGGGVVVDGRLRLGAIGSAGELGHLIVEPDGRPCGCGGHGCLETFASGPALVGEAVRLLHCGQAPKLHEIVGGDVAKVTPRTMGDAAREGDEKIRIAIERAGRYLGVGIASLVAILYPDLVVIGGGVAGLGDLIFEPARRAVHEYVKMFDLGFLRIEPAVLGSRAGVLGAVALARRGGLLDQFPAAV